MTAQTGNQRPQITTGRLILFGIPLLVIGFIIFTYLRDQNTLENAKSVFENGNCLAAFNDLNRLESDLRILTIGNFVSEGELFRGALGTVSTCAFYNRALEDYENEDYASALDKFTAFIAGRDLVSFGEMGTFVNDLTQARIADVWANAEAIELVSEDNCSTTRIDDFNDNGIIQSEDNELQLYLGCIAYFLEETDYAAVHEWYELTINLDQVEDTEPINQTTNEALWGAPPEGARVTRELCVTIDDLIAFSLLKSYETSGLLYNVSGDALYGECAVYYATRSQYEPMLTNYLTYIEESDEEWGNLTPLTEFSTSIENTETIQTAITNLVLCPNAPRLATDGFFSEEIETFVYQTCIREAVDSDDHEQVIALYENYTAQFDDESAQEAFTEMIVTALWQFNEDSGIVNSYLCGATRDLHNLEPTVLAQYVENNLLNGLDAPTALGECALYHANLNFRYGMLDSLSIYIENYPNDDNLESYREQAANIFWNAIDFDELLPEIGISEQFSWCRQRSQFEALNLYANEDENRAYAYRACAEFLKSRDPNRVVEVYQEFLEMYPDSPYEDLMLDELAEIILDQAQTNNAGEIAPPPAIPQFESDGVVLFIQNASPEAIRITLIGPETLIETIVPCFDCPTYTTAPDGCPTGGIEERYEILEGTYSVVVESISDTGVTPFTGTWSLEDGNMYPNCFFILTTPF